jgi:hypothetical protein
MGDDEFRALVNAGPCVVMVQKGHMLGLLDERDLLRTRWLDSCVALERERDALRAEVAALRQAVERARGEALEEAARVAEDFRQSAHIAHDMRMGYFPKQSPLYHAIAAAIRARSDGTSEQWEPIPYTPGDPQPQISDGIYSGIRTDGRGGFEGIRARTGGGDA